MTVLGDSSLSAGSLSKGVSSSKEVLPSGSNAKTARSWAVVTKNSGAAPKKQFRPRKPPIPNCTKARGGMPASKPVTELRATLRRELGISSSEESFRRAAQGDKVISTSKNKQIDGVLSSVSREPNKQKYQEKQGAINQGASFDGMLNQPPSTQNLSKLNHQPAPLVSVADFDRKHTPFAAQKRVRSDNSPAGVLSETHRAPLPLRDSRIPPLEGESSNMMLEPNREKAKLGDENETQRPLRENKTPSNVSEKSRSSPIEKKYHVVDYEISPQPSPSPAPIVLSPSVVSPSSPSELSELKQVVKGRRRKHRKERPTPSRCLTKNVGNNDKRREAVSDTNGKHETLVPQVSCQEGGRNGGLRKENNNRRNIPPQKLGKSKWKRRNRSAMMNRHSTRPRANKSSEPSPMPIEEIYPQVRMASPVSPCAIMNRHGTRPRANKQSEPSPMPVEEIYPQVRMTSPVTATSHRSPRGVRCNSPNPNPRSSTPGAGSTMTFSSVTSMATTPASNNTNVNEKCPSIKFEEPSDPRESIKFEEPSDPREQEEGEALGVERGEGDVGPGVTNLHLGRHAVQQHINARADPPYHVQSGCVSPSAGNPVVCVFNPQGGPPTYYDLPPGASMMFSNGGQPSVYSQPLPCQMQVPHGQVQQVYNPSLPGTSHPYYQQQFYAPQVQFQQPQFYEQPHFQTPVHSPFSLMGNHHRPVNVNLPLTTENVNMHNLTNMS